MPRQKSIEKLVLKNFKAFRQEQAIDLKKKNILIYGNNGSGKSSIFWALYTFLQSSIKYDAGVEKYFKVFDENAPDTWQSLRNVFESADADSYIKLVVEDNGNPLPFTIAGGNVETNKEDVTIKFLNTTSDFINYKLLSNFYKDSHRFDVNLWPVFERDIFPFITDNINDQTFLDKIIAKTSDVERYASGYALRDGWRKWAYEERMENFNKEIDVLLGQIQQTANQFIKEHFYNNKDVLKITLLFDRRFNFDLIHERIWADNKKHIRDTNLRIKLVVENYDTDNQQWIKLHRVQSFLNEAQLTRIAIGVRIGALRARLQDTDFKLLVLDDMLISLDLSNRMEITKIILNHSNKPSLRFFDKFQKVILTHDKGFYNLMKNYTNPNDWEYYKLSKPEDSAVAPELKIDKTHLEKAQKFFADGDYDACGNELRKEVETIVKKYLNKGLNKESEEFQELSKMLKSAYEAYTLNERRAFNKVFVDNELSLEMIKKLDEDFENDAQLNGDQKLKLRILKKELHNYLYKQYEVKGKVGDAKDKLFADIKAILDRIMNPASHSSGESMYEKEIEEAIKRIEEFKFSLNGN